MSEHIKNLINNSKNEYKKILQSLTYLEEVSQALKEIIKDGDYWIFLQNRYIEGGNCPMCFASDELGHYEECGIFKLMKENEELAIDNEKLLEENDKLSEENDKLLNQILNSLDLLEKNFKEKMIKNAYKARG